MRISLSVILLFLILTCGAVVLAQDKPTPQAAPRAATTAPTRAQTGFDLTESGVRIQPDARLVVMMAALDAAGFDPTPKGQEPSAFRAQVRREQSDLDSDLRQRMRTFFERNNRALLAATPAEQASRYVSLAYALGSTPGFESPPRTDDLPGELLEVLDFAPLMREFYRKSGIDERLPEYLRKYQAEGDHLRPATIEMVRSVANYLHTRPLTTMTERVPVKSPDNKKNARQGYTTRERERRFYIVPDLLAVPGTINYRVIADDYYVIVPFNTNIASSKELRRAYIQYVIDPIVLRYNRDVAARRAQVKTLLDGLNVKPEDGGVSPDVFLAVMRSLVAATDARMDETAKIDALTREARRKLEGATSPEARGAITRELQEVQRAASDESAAQLSDAYERGAVLAFYFAEQLKGIETSGFDISNFFADMMASFDPARESKRLTENAEARKRAADARKLRQAQVAANAEDPESSSRAAFIKSMSAVDDLLRVKNYAEAETRLRALMQDYQGEPRIFFALGQAASLSAEDATDEDVQRQRLTRALTHYRNAINISSADTDRALVQRAYAAMGRIQEFFENTEEALKAFDAAIKLGPVDPNAYDEAVKGKARLGQQK
jgi:tetratricopeptide (TPR) repeat protein